MKNRLTVPRFLLYLAAALFCRSAVAQTVRFQTNLGDIDVTLLTDSAPATVENFLKYVNRGSFRNTFFHRSVPGFVIQGGGYQFDTSVKEIPSDPPVRNEFRVSNTRGTVAMAKFGNDPNSATNQWFFNLANNASTLNFQNGGFTVFGRVTNAAGLAVMDRIAEVPVFNTGSPFDQLPLQNYTGGAVMAANLVLVTAINFGEQLRRVRIGGGRIVYRHSRVEPGGCDPSVVGGRFRRRPRADGARRRNGNGRWKAGLCQFCEPGASDRAGAGRFDGGQNRAGGGE